MKKFLTKISLAAVLLCSLLFTGCGAANAVVDYMSGTYGKWYKYNTSQSITLPLSTEDSETSTKTYDFKAVEIYVKFHPDSGLTVALQASRDENVELYNGLFSTTTQLTYGGTKQYTTEQFGSGKWILMLSTGKFVAAEEPEISAHPERCIKLDDFSQSKIQWKKFLANYLLDLLLK